ncbi:MAG: hypothetical protein DMH00_02475 [Acidobacteria bacterium]|nr:MAG: hypothetical protein DMH00_02475 [Acidobacteriota bacterium]
MVEGSSLKRRFEYFHEGLNPRSTLVVDGVAPPALNLSHWPGNRTPPRYRADTTTEMALLLAADPGRETFLSEVEVISNNHFDTDGLLSVWAVLHPQEALRHRRFVVDAARAGDFGTFTSPDAVKFDLLVTTFEDPQRSPVAPRLRGLGSDARSQAAYEELLGRLPELFYQSGAHRRIWEDEFESIVHSFQRLREGGARIREYPSSSVSVIETDEELEKMARLDSCRFHRVLTATRDGRGYRFQLEHHVFSWFDTVTPPRGARLDLSPLALELNALEPCREGRWIYTGNHDLEAKLFLADGEGEPLVSGLPLERVEALVTESLRGR